MTKQAKDDYWKVVVEMLVVYYGWGRRKATGKVGWHRPVMDPYKHRISACYHFDPFQTAGDFSGKAIPDQIYLTRDEKRVFVNGVLGRNTGYYHEINEQHND